MGGGGKGVIYVRILSKIYSNSINDNQLCNGEASLGELTFIIRLQLPLIIIVNYCIT